MTPVELIEDLETRGVELWVEGDRLRYRGERDLLTADVLEKLKDRKAEIVALQRERAQRATLSPVSYGQSALWFLHQLAPGSSAYNVGFAARVRPQIDESAMRRSLERLLARHASLRTTFPVRNGGPVQEIHANLSPAFEAIDVGSVSDQDLIARVADAYRCPFDLAAGPLLRFQVFSPGREDQVLLLTVHHLVCDAWSLWLLLEELGELYSADVDARPARLPELAAGYADYVRWQRQFLRGAEGERQWAYWKGVLGGELPVLDLPTDKARPAELTFNGASHRFRLDAQLSAAVKAFASAEGTTTYMVLLAAFEALLHRYTGQDEIVLGSPTSGRTQAQFAGTVGDFINTVVLRASCAGDPGFRSFLADSSGKALEAIAHEEFPFSLAVERLGGNRDVNRAPLFQVLFNYLKPQRFHDIVELYVASDVGDGVGWGGLTLGPFPLFQQEGQVDLALEVVEGKTCLHGLLKYNTDLFDEATIARMAGHLETLIRGAIAEPDCPLSRLPLLTPAERHQLLVEWNDTRADFPRDACAHHLFEAQVGRTPQAVAAQCGGEAWPYRELNARADELAARLVGLGVRPGVTVALCIERSLQMLAALLGVLKAGGAYVPLDPDNPRARLEFILQDSGVGLLITQDHVRAGLGFHGSPAEKPGRPGSNAGGVDDLVILQLPGAAPGGVREDTSRTTRRVTSDDLAYLIYTSGSTGQPKGVEIRHRSVVNFLHSMAKAPGFGPDDAILALTTLSFDIAALELLLPITVGGRVVIAGRDVAVDPEKLAAAIEEAGITIVQATPATWRLLVDGGWRGKSGLKILVGGEALTAELASQLLTRCSSLWNMYGPTETTIWSGTSRVTAANQISLGRPIANTQFYVVQRGNQLAPVGVAGELLIGGEGLARGYWERPSLTDAAFVPHPFDPQPGARLYRTGDLVRYRADGLLEFLGRTDHQVKIRGYRVELGEIEAALRLHPHVRDAVVVVREDAHRDKRMVGYVIPAGDESLSAQELRSHLAARLPEYMVVSSFVPVEAFPLTASGKIDRKALPEPRQEAASPGGPASPSLTPTQSMLATIWAELLGVVQPGLDESLFNLGGHSLTAVRLVSTIHRRLSVKLPVMTIFSHPTIRELASVIDDHKSGLAGGTGVPKAARPVAAESQTAPEARRTRFRISGKRSLGSEHVLWGPVNRVLQMIARAAPGALRPLLHRWRGVSIGDDVLIGYDSVIETSYPWLVSIGSRSAIGMRVTIIGHFLRMEHAFLNQRAFSVEIGEDVWIGPGSLILPNVTIGNGSVVAAGSVVSGSVAPGMLVQGNPARAVARCPIPLRPGMRFEEFVESLEPLDGHHDVQAG